LAGFRCTRLPTNVDGNQKRLVRNLHGIDPAVTFKVVAARHENTILLCNLGRWSNEINLPSMISFSARGI
nr:hypothetical protein [Candidatus Sigynarchaeum springense]